MPTRSPATRGSDVPLIKVVIFDGAAAGDQTVPGIGLYDELISVIAWPDAGGAPTNVALTEFTITAANTINNTGGTSLAGKVGICVFWPRPTNLG